MYSPPPMDGFSPPPMSDFSPPPLEDLSPLNDFPPSMNGFSPPSDDDGDVGADDNYDFGICDTYDLTGLSEKMNSLEFDKMKNLPPREILELKKESSELNNLYSNNLKIESKEHMATGENNNDGAYCIHEHLNGVGDGDLFSSDNTKLDNCDNIPPGLGLSDQVETTAIPDFESSDGLNDRPENHVFDNKDSEYISQNSTVTVLDNKDVLSNDESYPNICVESEFINGAINTLDDLGLSRREKYDVLPEQPEACDDSIDALNDNDKDLFEMSRSCNDPPDALFCGTDRDQTSIDKNTEPTEDEWGDFPDQSKVDESWGNFNEIPNEGERWGSFDHSSKTQVVADQRTKDSEVRKIEFDDFSDDEFGDFGEANTKPEKIAKEVHEQSLSSQLEKLEGVGENLTNSIFGENCKALKLENSSCELDLEKDVLNDSVIFQPMENPALTPGLDYKWRDSATYTIMLYTLGIDSRVVLDGEGWRSSVPRYVPKTAATLLTPGLLTPQPVASTGEKQDEPPHERKDTPGSSCGVSPAEFDWNNSGLTNPLEENGLSEEKNAQKATETPKVITELLASQNKQRLAENKSLTVLQKHTSREVKNILDGFPLLNFMTSSVLMFPTKSIDKKK